MRRTPGAKSIRDGLTRQAVAQRYGLSPATIGGLVKQRVLRLIPAEGKPPHTWGLDPSSVKEVFGDLAEGPQAPGAEDVTEASSNGSVTGNGALASYWRAKSDREIANAGLAELKLKQEEGDLLERAEVEDALFNMSRMTRDRMLAIADRLAHLLVGATNERQIRDVIRREIHSALEGLSEELEGVAGYGEQADPDTR
jgi:hypothetical protein